MKITLETASQLLQSIALLLQQIQIMQHSAASQPQSKSVNFAPEDELKAQDLNKKINELLGDELSSEGQYIVEFLSFQFKEIFQVYTSQINELKQLMRVLETRNHTLEEFFQRHQAKAVDFGLRAEINDGTWRFYIHPVNVDGETWDFEIRGNQLTCVSIPSVLTAA